MDARGRPCVKKGAVGLNVCPSFSSCIHRGHSGGKLTIGALRARSQSSPFVSLAPQLRSAAARQAELLAVQVGLVLLCLTVGWIILYSHRARRFRRFWNHADATTAELPLMIPLKEAAEPYTYKSSPLAGPPIEGDDANSSRPPSMYSAYTPSPRPRSSSMQSAYPPSPRPRSTVRIPTSTSRPRSGSFEAAVALAAAGSHIRPEMRSRPSITSFAESTTSSRSSVTYGDRRGSIVGSDNTTPSRPGLGNRSRTSSFGASSLLKRPSPLSHSPEKEHPPAAPSSFPSSMAGGLGLDLASGPQARAERPESRGSSPAAMVAAIQRRRLEEQEGEATFTSIDLQSAPRMRSSNTLSRATSYCKSHVR